MSNGIAGPASSETITGAKLLELNDYDRQRKLHPVISDDTMIQLRTKTLSSEITCPICLDLFTSTLGTKECLHRFCSECINTALLRNNRECPTCRKKIVSKRSLRPDVNMDGLINKLWPERRLYDEMQNAANQHYHQEASMASLQKSIEAGIRAQALNRRQRVIGSYDYEKKKRRKKNVDGAEEDEATPNLSPRNEDNENDTDAAGPSQLKEDDEPGSSGVSDSERGHLEDSSSLSSTISDSSELDSMTSEAESRSMSMEPQTALAGPKPPSLEKMAELSLGQGQTLEEEMSDERDASLNSGESRPISYEIELELVPTRPFRKRPDISPHLKKPRFIKVNLNCTMEHLGAFLKMAARADADEENNAEAASDSSGGVILEPKYFFYISNSFQIEQADGPTTLNQIHSYSPALEAHLKLVFDSQPHDDTQRDAAVGGELDLELDPDPEEDPDYPGH